MRSTAYRLFVPGTVLLLYAAMAALWLLGLQPVYFVILRQFGFEPFRFPFLDIHAILAAGQCGRLGIDVYSWNPCDALGRPHVYSPLWLAFPPSLLDTGRTTAVGLGLGALYIGSLAALCRPYTRHEALLMGLTAISPMSVYALERANNDVVVFLLVLTGCAFLRARGPARFGAYLCYLIAGLLKYYPLVLLILLARERRRTAILGAGAISAALLCLVTYNFTEIEKALANIPAPSYFADSFAAVNLPFGFASALQIPFGRIFASAFLACLGILMVARARRSMRVFGRAPVDWSAFEADCLIAGSLLLVACFLTARNIDYRGIYFALVMPGLVVLRRTSRDSDTRKLLSQLILVVLFVAWEQALRHLFEMAAASLPAIGLQARAEMLFWLGRELVWWWLIAGLSAIVCCHLRRLPIAVGAIAMLPKVWRSAPPVG